jgi:SAM-dependent methyltransferase
VSRYADDLAYVHHTGFADLARGAAPFLVSLLRSRGIVGTVVDLGCGSGVVLAALVEAGHHAIGVDLSRSMLELARASAPAAQLVRASLYDVDAWDSGGGLAAVFGIGEPLNYDYAGEAPALPPFFRRVRRALAPGGLFVFDVIVRGPGPSLSKRGFASGETWATLVETVENPARTMLVREITSFVRRAGEERYRRAHEVHRVRVLDTGAVASALRKSGFRVRVASSYGAHPLAVRRRAFLCRRA